MASKSSSPIVELRQYELVPQARETLIELFEREFVETQEAVGLQVIGQFRDLDGPDRFVWLRGFADMESRAVGLDAFYNGPVWAEHRDAANVTMIDSDNVLLLRTARPSSGFVVDEASRPHIGASATSHTVATATVYHHRGETDGEEITDLFETRLQPALIEAGASVLAYFISERNPNNFPRLPVREGENVFAWFARFDDLSSYERHLDALAQSGSWQEASEQLQGYLAREPELLRLTPTARSLI